jgi:hypothetical protein
MGLAGNYLRLHNELQDVRDEDYQSANAQN